MSGITVQTLRRWERKGEWVPDRKGKCGTKYDIDRLLGIQDIETDLTIGYVRAFNYDQKDDLSLFCFLLVWCPKSQNQKTG